MTEGMTDERVAGDPVELREGLLALLEDGETVFVCDWVAHRSGLGEAGEQGSVRTGFTAAGRSAAEVREVIAAECVRQDADPAFGYVREFGPMREISLVSSETVDEDDLEGTMAFRLRRAARATEARKAAEAAARGEDPETARRRAAYEELRAEFEPPRPRAERTPAERAAQAEMLEYAERDGGRFMEYDLVRIGRELDIEHPELLVADLVDRGFLRDLGIWNSGGVMHGERCLALARGAERCQS